MRVLKRTQVSLLTPALLCFPGVALQLEKEGPKSAVGGCRHKSQDLHIEIILILCQNMSLSHWIFVLGRKLSRVQDFLLACRSFPVFPLFRRFPESIFPCHVSRVISVANPTLLKWINESPWSTWWFFFLFSYFQIWWFAPKFARQHFWREGKKFFDLPCFREATYILQSCRAWILSWPCQRMRVLRVGSQAACGESLKL